MGGYKWQSPRRHSNRRSLDRNRRIRISDHNWRYNCFQSEESEVSTLSSIELNTMAPTSSAYSLVIPTLTTAIGYLGSMVGTFREPIMDMDGSLIVNKFRTANG